MKYNFNIERFLNKFEDNYKWLYNGGCSEYEQNEATEQYYTLMDRSDNFKKFVFDFCKYRGDIISSDREAASFIITMYDFMEK